jgi:hypothetical protein
LRRSEEPANAKPFFSQEPGDTRSLEQKILLAILGGLGGYL